MPRTLKPAHPCENPECGAMTEHLRYCCQTCQKRHKYAEEKRQSEEGGPIKPHVLRQFADWRARNEARQQKAMDAAAQAALLRIGVEVNRPYPRFEPGQERIERVKHHAAPHCSVCGYRPAMEGERTCLKCRGKERGK
jgi:hypothetical protein